MVPPNRRLNGTDFEVTKVIYTDQLGLGSETLMGSVNIIANGGENQPNCVCDVFPCSHFTATTLFTESIRSNQTKIYPIVSQGGTKRDFFTLRAIDSPGVYNLTTIECYPYVSK